MHDYRRKSVLLATHMSLGYDLTISGVTVLNDLKEKFRPLPERFKRHCTERLRVINAYNQRLKHVFYLIKHGLNSE